MREVKTKAGASVKEWKPPTTQEKAAQNVCRSKKPDKSLRNREGRVALREMVMPELGLMPRDIPPAEDGDVLCESRIQHLCDFLSSGGVLQRWLDAAGVTRSQYTYRKNRQEGLKMRLEEAMYVGCDALADRALEIAHKPFITVDEVVTTLADGRQVTVTKTADNVFARKLAVQATIDILKRRAPDRYGDAVKVEVADSRARAIIDARRRLREAKDKIIEAEVVG